jgi:Rieske 2Fe-2S family protein
MQLVEGAETMALDGGHGSRGGRPAMCGITPVDEQRIYYFVLWPLTFLSIHPDYLLVHRLVPTDPGHTRVECEWLFEADTIEAPGFDPADAVAFWDLTNRQDWHVCELQQRGTRSRSWTAGRYSNQEASVQAFDLMVADRYAADSVVSQRFVRERYDTPQPKHPTSGDGANGGGTGDDRVARRPERAGTVKD